MLKQEYEKQYRLNRIYLDEQTSYKVGEVWRHIRREDYAKGSGVEPISDPNMVADAQRMAKANFLAQFANDPEFNGRAIRRRVLEAAQIDRIDELLEPKPTPNPAAIAKLAELSLRQVEVKARAVW